jgi:hypothetical protein
MSPMKEYSHETVGDHIILLQYEYEYLSMRTKYCVGTFVLEYSTTVPVDYGTGSELQRLRRCTVYVRRTSTGT